MGERRAFVLLLVGLAVVALAAWIARNQGAEDPTPKATSSTKAPTPTRSGSPGYTARWGIDGDTLDVTFPDGTVQRVRLVGINAPELKHSAAPAECLATEASRALVDLAPRGSELRLELWGTDRYGRTLAGVWLADGRFLAAEIVRQGLAAPLVVGGKDPYHALVAAARSEAASAGRGLHASSPSCTAAGRLVALEVALRGLPAQVGTGDRSTYAGQARATVEAATLLLAELDATAAPPGVAALLPARRADLRADTAAVLARARSELARLDG